MSDSHHHLEPQLQTLMMERVNALKAHVNHLAPNRAVTIVAVSKYTDVVRMAAAAQAGLQHFAESRVQDALEKQDYFQASSLLDRSHELHWHFIGTLQSNKLASLVGKFALIQSVASLRHAHLLSSQCEKAGLRQPVLLQVNPGDDASRNGLMPDHLRQQLDQCLALPGLDIQGLMAMAPPELSLADDEVGLNRVFESVRLLRDELAQRSGLPLKTLSMGMSRDYPQALAQGATIIRVGNVLFGSDR